MVAIRQRRRAAPRADAAGLAIRRELSAPPARVEHLFTGWGGRAVFAWPARHYALEVAADARAYWLHASAQPARFCFHALGGPAEGAGLADRDDDAVWVDAGATLSAASGSPSSAPAR